MTVLPLTATRPDRRVLAGIVSVVIVAGVFGFALPQIASYHEAWQDLTGMTGPWLLAVAAAAVASPVTSWLAFAAVLPQVRLREAAAVSLSSSAVANTVPGGGAVSLGVSWRMLAGWGVTTPQFVRCTLVSGLWNVFARLGLPAAALIVMAAGGGPAAGIPPVAAYCGGAVLLVTVAGFRALLRSPRAATVTARVLQACATGAARLARRPPPAGLADGVLRFRRDTTALLAERGARITAATAAAQLTPWLVLLACLRASGLGQGQVSWQLSLAAFALARLLTVLPITPGGLGLVELGLAGPLAAGLGVEGAAKAAAAILLFRAVTYLPSLPLGALAYAWWRRTCPDSGSCSRSQLVPEKAT
jgi:putative heme transporter